MALRYLSTFHTHFGAMSFLRRLKAQGDAGAEMLPVPRELSASCGVCVRYEAAELTEVHKDAVDLDHIYLVTPIGYQPAYSAE